MAFLVPNVIFRNVTHITPAYLANADIKALVLDVDNTLAEHDSQTLRQDVADWLDTMRRHGILMMIASNNTKRRVQPFAQKLGLPFVSFSCKPSPRYLAAARKRWGIPRSAIALVGDQVFTDLMAGALYGVRVLMVRPLYEDVKPTIRIKRVLEYPFIARYYRKGGKLM